MTVAIIPMRCEIPCKSAQARKSIAVMFGTTAVYIIWLSSMLVNVHMFVCREKEMCSMCPSEKVFRCVPVSVLYRLVLFDGILRILPQEYCLPVLYLGQSIATHRCKPKIQRMKGLRRQKRERERANIDAKHGRRYRFKNICKGEMCMAYTGASFESPSRILWT